MVGQGSGNAVDAEVEVAGVLRSAGNWILPGLDLSLYIPLAFSLLLAYSVLLSLTLLSLLATYQLPP